MSLLKRSVPLLCAPGDRDRVHRQRQPAREERVVVRRSRPGEHLARHAAPEEVTHEVECVARALALDRDPGVGVLDVRPEALQEGDEGHVRVELLGHADPDRVAHCLEPRSCTADVLPARRPDSHLAPEIGAVVDGIRDVVVREAEVLLRSRVVGALPPDAAHLPDLPLDLLDEVVDRDHAILVRRRRREELEQVVAALSSHFRGGPGWKFGQVDVIDPNLGVVRLAPTLDVHVVEPLVVRRHEVTPLDDAERSGELPVSESRHPSDGRLCPARPVDEDDGSQRGSPQELASRELVVDLRDVDALPPVLHSDHLSSWFSSE